MTSIEWLLKELRIEMGCGKDLCKSYQGVYEEIINEAKEMHKQEIIDAFEKAYGSGYRDNGDSGIDYYAETFVSKGSDDTLKDYHIVDTNKMIEVPQQEISDEEIEKMLFHHSNEYAIGFKDAIKWYREQLKKKQ